MVIFNLVFAGDGRAHEKYAAPPRAGEAQRPVSCSSSENEQHAQLSSLSFIQ